MTIGRPNKPIEQKRLTGTLRPDRIPASPVLLSNDPNPPATPSTLEAKGRDFWETVWATNWVSQTSDYHLALITAESIDERERVREALAEDPRDRRLRVTLRELDKQLISSLSLLGYTPSDRSRLGVAEVKTESKLEELMRRRGALHPQNSRSSN
jgi:hypothetical protein